MSYRINTINNGTKIVNKRDEILQLLRDGQIGPNSRVLDTDLNLELKVSDVLSPKDLEGYHEASGNSFPNSRPFENANQYNQMEQNGEFTSGKSKPGKLKIISFVMVSILILLTGLTITLPRLGEAMKTKDQQIAAKRLLKDHFDNLLGHSQPKTIEISQKEYGKNYKSLQGLNDSYSNFYKSFEKYVDLSKGINDKDFEKSQKSIDDILPVITDCSNKYAIFVSNLETASGKYHVDINKFSKNVDNYTEYAKSLTLEYYDSHKKVCETIISLRKLLTEKQGTYKKIGTAYLFETEEDKDKFNTLIAQYNDSFQKKEDCYTKLNFLKKGSIVDITRK